MRCIKFKFSRYTCSIITNWLFLVCAFWISAKVNAELGSVNRHFGAIPVKTSLVNTTGNTYQVGHGWASTMGPLTNFLGGLA